MLNKINEKSNVNVSEVLFLQYCLFVGLIQAGK